MRKRLVHDLLLPLWIPIAHIVFVYANTTIAAEGVILIILWPHALQSSIWKKMVSQVLFQMSYDFIDISGVNFDFWHFINWSID